MRIAPLLVLLLLVNTGSALLHAQVTPAPEATAADQYPVTATPEMGDPGGTFFGRIPDPAKTRHYYIAAEPELWNFAPEGQDPVCGKFFPSSLLLYRTSWKIRYVQYADAEFTARVLPSDRLGMMGPVLRGVTGEYLAVTFLNRSWRPVSMHPHGVHYDKASEGSYYKPAPGLGSAVAPGARFTYVWHLDEAAGPRPEEPSSKGWLYHSHVAGDEEINLGLFGMIVVTDAARARADGTPRDVDREMAAVFQIFDEANLPDSDADTDERPANAPVDPIQRTWADIQQATEEGERHTINGRTFGNLGGLEMNEGERVRWYMFGLGSEKDFHTAHWHGHRVLEEGRRRTDVVELLPASMKVADMVADNPGSWLLHCHVADHMESGMYAGFNIHPASAPAASRDPEQAFFGLPGTSRTLRFQSTDLTLDAAHPEITELNASGQVTVPDPFPVARHPFVVQVGARSITFHPDASGICVEPEGILVVKNGSLTGNGTVTGGILNFDFTLKGGAWLHELEQLHVLEKSTLAASTELPVSLNVGPAHHVATATLKLAVP